MENNIQILPLNQRPEFFDEVVNTYYEQWSRPHGNTRESVAYRTKHAMNDNSVPQTLIALKGDQLVGVVSLWMCDLRTRQDLYPFLAGLYVNPSCRSMGIGKMLQQEALRRAKKYGYKYLHLTTDHENYYERTGWKLLDIAPSSGEKYTRVYQFDLSQLDG